MEELRSVAGALAARLEREIEGLPDDEALRRALRGLAEAGLLRWCVPARHGGAPAPAPVGEEQVSVGALCAIRRELAYSSGLVDVAFVMQGLGAYPIAAGGTPEQCRRYLPLVAEGRAISALGLTEPGAGSSLSEVTTRAEPRGEGWLLNGHKTFISNAPLADFFSVLARVPGSGEDAFAMFLVDGRAPGLERRAFEVMAPHPIGDVLFHDVELQPACLLGRLGGGIELALATLARFRTTVAAAAVGYARAALDESIRHLGQRRQFGRPLATFQALRFDVAEMDTRLRAAELLVAEAAQAMDAGRAATVEVARAKLYATECAGWICDRAVQHLGGLGVKRGEKVERLYREVRALRIYEGTSEIQKLILAKEIFGSTGG